MDAQTIRFKQPTSGATVEGIVTDRWTSNVGIGHLAVAQTDDPEIAAYFADEGLVFDITEAQIVRNS